MVTTCIGFTSDLHIQQRKFHFRLVMKGSIWFLSRPVGGNPGSFMNFLWWTRVLPTTSLFRSQKPTSLYPLSFMATAMTAHHPVIIAPFATILSLTVAHDNEHTMRRYLLNLCLKPLIEDILVPLAGVNCRCNLVPRSSQPSERTSGKIRFDDVIMCQECDLLRAHAFLHTFRNGGLRWAFVHGRQGNLRGCVEMHSLQARNGGIVS